MQRIFLIWIKNICKIFATKEPDLTVWNTFKKMCAAVDDKLDVHLSESLMQDQIHSKADFQISWTTFMGRQDAGGDVLRRYKV